MAGSVVVLEFEQGRRFSVSVPGGSDLYDVLESCTLDRRIETDDQFIARCVAENKIRLVDE